MMENWCTTGPEKSIWINWSFKGAMLNVENYRRTSTGKGRTKKPGLQGTVKKPFLLLLSTMPVVAFNMVKFLFMLRLQGVFRHPKLSCKEKQLSVMGIKKFCEETLTGLYTFTPPL